MLLQRNQAIKLLDQLGSKQEPFVLLSDFEGSQAYIKKLSELDGSLQFSFPQKQYILPSGSKPEPFQLDKFPDSLASFKLKFDQVVSEIKFGNSFLVNLTCKTPIATNYELQDIFYQSNAKYKVLMGGQFVCFSPETFVKIDDNHIYSYPMKGTIDASIENAAGKILKDEKETAEHVTIVDLIRNDLSQVAKNVTVERFRYIDEIQTHEKRLLQVSSEIKGLLDGKWQQQIGSLIFKLLPAGSISGAPKPKTTSIIKETEGYKRGFYSGVCGFFDGKSFDSAVMIRFIEQEDNQLYFKSGGGITAFSNLESEYKEVIDKIYVPIH